MQSSFVRPEELTHLLSRISYVPKRVAHHALHSGYDVLFRACGITEARSKVCLFLINLLPQNFSWRIWRLRSQPSQKIGLQAEFAALPWLLFGKQRLCHFIYGEDTFLFSPLWTKGSNFCVATLHYPPELLCQRVNPGSLTSLDGVIIVGENQRAWLQRFLDPNKIYYCPHHIDTHFFCPGEPREEASIFEYKIICVGSFLRDYDALLHVLRHLRENYFKEIILDLVGPPMGQQHQLLVEPGVRVHRFISDEALRELYRNSSLGVIPMTDCTANNAVLEMMACGLPVVTTDVGGMKEYGENSGMTLVPMGNLEVLSETVIDLLRDPVKRHSLGVQSRSRAEREYSLEACALKMAIIYEKVLKSKK